MNPAFSLLATDDDACTDDACNNDALGQDLVHSGIISILSKPNLKSGAMQDDTCRTSSSRYGSTGTLSTVTYYAATSSGGSSPSSGSTGDGGGSSNNSDSTHIPSLSLDLAGERCALMSAGESLSGVSSSSSSDDDGNDYSRRRRCRHRHARLSRLSRLKRRASSTALYIENSFLTLSNLKVALSFVLWWLCYMFMGIFGGSVAYMHFPRTSRDSPAQLPDFGYDVIPYYCPQIPHVPHGNVQSVVLFLLYAIIFGGVIVRWKPRYHPATGKRLWGGDGRLILQQLYHLNCLVFVTRTSTVVMTGLPQPNPKCTSHQHYPVTFRGALSFVVGRGFPPHACGDLIYSGHVGCTLICMAVLHRHGFLRNRAVAALVWTIALIGIYFTISCRSHYTVDVVLACYFGYFLPEWYMNRSDGIIGGRVSRIIRWLEVRPRDLELDWMHHTAGPKDDLKNVTSDDDALSPTIDV
mmetsp:Transcript_19432/g.43182  ORF Transcript_19432/g.43182 Transcript_19432/m.43182 type:complete len:467 (-) Transcript_19432:141-1541(-)